jgi:hypothetical protein
MSQEIDSKKEALIAEMKAFLPKGFVSNFTRVKKLDADIEKWFSEGLLTDPNILMNLLAQAMYLVIEAKSTFEAEGFVSNFTRAENLEAKFEKWFSDGGSKDPDILMSLLAQAMFLVGQAKSSFEADEEAVQATRQAVEFWTSL